MQYIANKLAPLASEVMQRRYIVQGTQAEYLLTEELIEDAYAAVRLVQSDWTDSEAVDAEAKAQILALAPLLAAEAQIHLAESAIPVDALVSHPAWLALRTQAQACLRALRFDLAAWEAAQ